MFLLLFGFFFNLFSSQTYTAKIIGITDGDTVSILYQNKKKNIRLAHIDAPEKKQPFGQKAKQFISNQIFGKLVTLIITDKPDRNGRWIAEIFYNQRNINQDLVQNGLAWHFKKYSKNSYYNQLELQARKNKIGLWKEPNPTPPWKWRSKKI